jgi:Subtilase family/Fervidolysin N-terminal prodomain
MPDSRIRRRRSLLALTTLTLIVTVTVASSASGRSRGDASGPALRPSVPGEVIVGFARGVSAAEQNALLDRLGAKPKRRFGRIRGALASIERGSVEQTIRQLEHDPRVEYAEPNYLLFADHHGGTPNDPSFHQLWGLDNFGQTVNGVMGAADADIDAPEAWATTTGSSEVVVAVIDTGVDVSHPDLAANIWVNPGEDCTGCRTNGLDDDGNGYVDDWRGWDFVNGDNNPSDDHGHGTHVAGTIAAAGDNGIGVAGVTWSSRIMPLKFLSASGSGTTADAISAILYANAKDVPILNNSWGGEDFSQALLDAVRQTDASGALFIAAAGNSFTNTDLEPNYPSGFDVPNVVSVGATDAADRKAWFSNYGVSTVDVSAPGLNIVSTWPGGAYRSQDGTSMAAPHVAGAAALAKSAFPTASGVGLKALLLRTVDPLASLTAASRTAGRLNAHAALACATAPQTWIESPAPGFEVDAGEPVSITALAASCGRAAEATVSASVNGSTVELSPRGDGLYTAEYVSAPGPVTISVATEAGGSIDTRSVSGMAIANYDIVSSGPPVTVTTAHAGENAKLHFDGLAGQRISLRLSNVTIGSSTCCSTKVSINKPDGSSLIAAFLGTTGATLPATLPATGTYTILVDPQGANAGAITLTLTLL